MKIQDLGFIFAFIVLIFMRKPVLFASAGLLFLVLAIPLFSMHIFFTAERLTWYAAACFLFSLLLSGQKKKLCSSMRPI